MTILNAVSAMLLTLINGLLGIVVTKLVIEYFGSDFNGLNSTANQIINVLLVIEGGFTLASNVVLFSPLGRADYKLVNNILYVTRKKFRVIGVIFAALGFGVALIYTFLVNSELNRMLILSVISMAVIPSAFNLFYATTYRVLLQTMQREYIINFANVITIGLGHICTIVMILLGGSVWLVRLITMLFALLNSILIVMYTKRNCDYLDIKDNGCDVIIPGTRDVMIQKITGIIYSAAPIVFLSISPSGGTVLASVYAVYNNVFNMVKSVLRSIIDAPRLSIGQMLACDERNKVWEVFKQYEYIAILSIFLTCTTSYALVLPFISVYTRGITDANYYDSVIAIMMVLITVFEIIHIPSGHLINMAGEFRVSMYFQSVACIALIVSMFLGGIKWGIYGLIISVLLVAIILAILEVGYVHIVFFREKMKEFIVILMPNVVIGVFVAVLEKKYVNHIDSYLSFFLYGVLLLFLNVIICGIVGLIFSRNLLCGVARRGLNLIKRM